MIARAREWSDGTESQYDDQPGLQMPGAISQRAEGWPAGAASPAWELWVMIGWVAFTAITVALRGRR